MQQGGIDMEWVTSLDFEKVANAIVILVTGLLVAFGFKSGRSAAPSSARPALDVAADIFDAEAIGALTREITGQAVAITAQGAAMAGQTLAIDRQTVALEKHTEETEELRHSVNRLREALDRTAMEMARRG